MTVILRLCTEVGLYFPPVFLSEILADQRTFWTPCDNPTSGPVVRYLKLTIVLWKLKPSVVIRSPFRLSLFVPLTHTFHWYGYMKCLALQVYYVTEGRCWVRQPFVLVPVWISSLEESAKARLGLCVMVNNHLLCNASLKVTRQ